MHRVDEQGAVVGVFFLPFLSLEGPAHIVRIVVKSRPVLVDVSPTVAAFVLGSGTEEEILGMGSQNGELAGTDDAALFTLEISVPPGGFGEKLEVVCSQGDVSVRGAGDNAAAVQGQPRDLLGLGRHHAEEGHLDGAVGTGEAYRV